MTTKSEGADWFLVLDKTSGRIEFTYPAELGREFGAEWIAAYAPKDPAIDLNALVIIQLSSMLTQRHLILKRTCLRKRNTRIPSPHPLDIC